VKKLLVVHVAWGHLPSIGGAELYYGFFFALKGEGSSALQYLKSSLKHLEEGGFFVLLPLNFAYLGWVYQFLGELELARNHLQKAIKMQKDLGNPFMMSFFYNELSMVHLDSGEFESAQSCAERALSLAQENKEKLWEGRSWIYLGRILGKKELTQMDEAKENILKGIRILEELKIQPWVGTGNLFLGELYSDRGFKEKALENFKKAEKMFQEMGMDYCHDLITLKTI